MATRPIYVETEEEIPEVVARLRLVSGDDTVLVLPSRSRLGQSRFNFQLLRNYASRLGKTVTVVCDDPAVQKMATETGFITFGALDAEGATIATPPPAPTKPRRSWSGRPLPEPTARIAVSAPAKLLTKKATELKPGRFLLYVVAAMMLVVGLAAAALYVPSASITLVAQAQQFTQTDVEIQAEPGKAPIRVRTNVISRTNSQGFKTTGVQSVAAVQAFGSVVYTNNCQRPVGFPRDSPGMTLGQHQELVNSNGITFGQTSPDVIVPWNGGTANANVLAVQPGAAGNVGSHTITRQPDGSSSIVGNNYDCLSVDNPAPTGGGVDKSDTPIMTESDFEEARNELESELRQGIAQDLVNAGQPGEKLSDTVVYDQIQFSTDHKPGDTVPSFSGTMTLQGEGDFYQDSDVHKAYQAYLSSKVPANEQLLTEGQVTLLYRILNASAGGHLTFIGTVSAFVAPKLDNDSIRARVVGRPLTNANLYLQGLPVRSSTITEKPFALPLMPLLRNRIDIHYVVEPGSVQATPSPVPTPVPSPS
jgi:hypothetical protein